CLYSSLTAIQCEIFSSASMAAPPVSVLASVVLAKLLEFSNRDVANILRNAVDPIAPDRPLGTGRINAAKAMQIDTPLPFVKLDLPSSIHGVIPIRGSARGTNLVNFKIEYGAGAAPTNWIQFH